MELTNRITIKLGCFELAAFRVRILSLVNWKLNTGQSYLTTMRSAIMAEVQNQQAMKELWTELRKNQTAKEHLFQPFDAEKVLQSSKELHSVQQTEADL